MVSHANGSVAPKRLALIFDDGPHEAHNPRFLHLFEEAGVRVTFAPIGKNAALHPGLIRAVHAAGHEIANHSQTHPHFNQLNAAAMRSELDASQQLIQSLTGTAPRWFWPPYGDREPHVITGVAAAGLTVYPIEQFNFVSIQDWDVTQSAESIRARATNHPPDRSVLCFHEWRAETLAQMPLILTDLKNQGCQFLTFSELAAS